jgi:hypothetical protein
VPVGGWAFVRRGVIETRAPDVSPAVIEVGEPVVPPTGPFVLDTFSSAGTLASRSGEIGATWRMPGVDDTFLQDNVPLASALVASGHLQIAAGYDRSGTTYLASGEPVPLGIDVFCEIDYLVPAVVAPSRPILELLLSALPCTGNAHNYTSIAAFSSGPMEIDNYNGSGAYNGFASVNQAFDVIHTLRVEVRAGATDIRVFNNASLLFSSNTMPELNWRALAIGLADRAFATPTAPSASIQVHRVLLDAL